MKEEKENIKSKLDELKTDLEIKLVKIELQKLKLKEERLLKNEEEISKNNELKKDIKVAKKAITKKKFLKKTAKQQKSIPKITTETKSIVVNKKAKTKKKSLIKILTKQSQKKISTPKIYLALGILIFAILLTLRYTYQKKELDNKEQLIKKQNEEIDFNSNNYFKEIEDEVSEDDLQDFSDYKDIPELIAKNTKILKTTKVTKKTNTKKTVKNDNSTVNKGSNNLNENLNNLNENLNLVEELNDKPLDKFNEEIDLKEKIKITSDYMKVVALQYLVKEKKFITPKKIKKTNSFSIRVKLTKFKKTTFYNKVKIMLVIKDESEKTLKIDIKEVDFNTNKTLYLTFFETIAEKLEVNKPYFFSIFANNILIQSSIKTI
ncbi:MAG: hypothetical protein L3J23_04300 [Flavobacteriaceae bacterium]|nr:hypothetical protein [Flavobacteriaceae bacterium]